MKGIELCRNFFFASGLPMLEREFPEELPRITAGIAGRGSECFGCDDEVSQDHDFSAGFTLWLNDEDERRFGFQLERAYHKLTSRLPRSGKSALGRSEHGVCRISDFFRRHLGFPGVPESWQQWFYTPDYAFAEVLNGSIFLEGSGEFSALREQIARGMPEDVRKKKLAYHAVMMAQSGQYNFARCLKHGETAAAGLALSDFVRHTVPLVFLLNGKFAPYYKWMFRLMRELPKLGGLADLLAGLLTGSLTGKEKIIRVEEIAEKVIAELAVQNLSRAAGNYLEPHAFAINESIVNGELRTLHIMEH